MDFYLLGKEQEQIVTEELKSIGCCDLCTLRYIFQHEPALYREKHGLQRILGKSLEKEEQNGDNKDKESTGDNDGQSTKHRKISPCIACLGLLDEKTRQGSLENIAKTIKESDIQAYSYSPALSLPTSLQIRAFSIWFYKSTKFPNIFGQKAEQGTPLKSVWKWICCTELKELVDSNADWSSAGSLSVNITMDYEDDSSECTALENYLRLTNKGKYIGNKKSFASRNLVESTLSQMTAETFMKHFQCPPVLPTQALKVGSITCNHIPIYIAGRYCKFSRTLSQTPWVIAGIRKTETSVEELISKYIIELFGCEQATFSGSGREDVDVRMLGKGRPFVFELINPRRTVFSETRMRALQNKINESTKLVSVRDLQVVEKKSVSVLKDGETSKRKNYCAVCSLRGKPVTQEILDKLNNQEMPLVLSQLTPIRVLHRRSLLDRSRSIFKMHAERVALNSSETETTFFKLFVSTQAGTYVKEFVHGDFGRTTPNVSLLLGTETDILVLDVEGVDLDWPPEIIAQQDSTT